MPCVAITEPEAVTFAPPVGGTMASIEASLLALLLACAPYWPDSLVACAY